MTPPIIPQEQSSVSGLLQNLVLSFLPVTLITNTTEIKPIANLIKMAKKIYCHLFTSANHRLFYTDPSFSNR